MATSKIQGGITRVALDYAAIAAIGLGVLMAVVGYPRRAVELLIAGMGLVALHSAHNSKIFRRLMGTSCMLR